jgi:hypothetical protein
LNVLSRCHGMESVETDGMWQSECAAEA